MKIQSPQPVIFHELGPVVEIKISDDLGATYFYHQGPLDKHFVRIWTEEETSWPRETEWNTTYEYGIEDVDMRAVPFTPDREPLESTVTYFPACYSV